MRPTWAEIDLDALAHNMREIRRIVNPKTKIYGVVKANAYGHGAIPVSKVLLANGADRLAVAILEEGIELRNAGFTVPILILGSAFPEQAEEIVRYDLTQAISNLDVAAAVAAEGKKQGKKPKVFIKLDTGMKRIGFQPDEAVEAVKKIAAMDGLEIEGIFSHLPVSDERDKTYTENQFAIFQKVYDDLKAAGVNIPIRALANSAAVIDLPHMHLDYVRPGIIIYGIYPSDEVQMDKIELRPVMSLKTRVIHLKKVPAGCKIGYGNTYSPEKDTMIASLPIGYADGYNRKLSNRGEVLIGGKRYRIAGRVCMDQCMVDVGMEHNIKVGDEVVLIGRQGDEFISADEIAAICGTIPHEITCCIGPRVPRKYIGTGK